MNIEPMRQLSLCTILLISIAVSQVMALENGMTANSGPAEDVNELLETILEITRPSLEEKALRASGDVTATDSGLTISQDSQLTIQFPHSSAWVIVESELTLPEAAQPFRCEWTFDLDQALDASIVLERMQVDGQWIDIITFNDSRVFFSEAVRKYSGADWITDGRWRFEYRLGLMVCETPARQRFYAKVDRQVLVTGEAACGATSVRAMTGELDVGAMQFQAGRQTEQSSDLNLLRITTMRLTSLIDLGDYDAVGSALPRLEQQIQLAIRNAPKSLESSGAACGLLSDLAWIHRRMGEYAAAEPLCRQGLEIGKTIYGDEHPETATNLSQLGLMYASTGDLAKAESLYRRSLNINQNVLGQENDYTAASFHNLAALYQKLGNYAQAEPLLRQGLTIHQKVLGDKHPHTATSLNELGGLYQLLGDYTKAERLFCESLEIRQSVLGNEHPDTATSLGSLAGLYKKVGNYEGAEQHYRESIEICQKVLGENHPETATCLTNLALLLWERGDEHRARPFVERSLANALSKLEQSSAVQTEQQQLLMTNWNRSFFSVWLTVTSLDESAEASWREAVPWKGLITARQASLRRSLKDDPAFSAYRTVTQQLSTLSLTPPLPPSDPKRLTTWRQKEPVLRQTWLAERTRLQTEHERLERELAIKSAPFRESQQRQRVTADQIIAALKLAERPVALVDVLEYLYYGRRVEGVVSEPSERRVAAFIVRPDREVVRVNLGPSVVINQQVKVWRGTLAAGDAGRVAGNALRRLLWEPLQSHLDGIDTILISPDGQLAQIPWGALPGSAPDSFLIEQQSIAVIPIPQVIPELLSREKSSGPPASLLLAGQIDYGGDPGTPQDLLAKREAIGRSRDGEANEWSPLPGAQLEMSSIQERYEHSHQIAQTRGESGSLSSSNATEAAFREQAEKHTWLHVITHGYFSPESVQSVLKADPEQNGLSGLLEAPQHLGPVILPGLLSGLVFAGANSIAEPEKDDGILTALDVTGLDLSRAEMVVLSACETGLGEVADGEGLLGLQRAFQVAGAKTVVASLWKVPDAATARLMQRFYENLWDRKMGKLEALREAQLWMMKDPSARGAGNPADKSARGAEVIKDTPNGGRLPPLYWAAFVLSGDWR